MTNYRDFFAGFIPCSKLALTCLSHLPLLTYTYSIYKVVVSKCHGTRPLGYLVGLRYDIKKTVLLHDQTNKKGTGDKQNVV